MMNSINMKHFDTLAYVKRARELGTSEELAEFQARTIEGAIDVAVGNIEAKELATKGDLRETELRLKNELIKWILATGATTILAIAGLLKFMLH